MFRYCRCVLNSLPFVPMALSTLDTLEQRMEASNLSGHLLTKTTSKPAKEPHTFSVGGTRKVDQLQWFSAQSPSPFFISPKHDGVRLISYVPPMSSNATATKNPSSKSKTSRKLSGIVNSDEGNERGERVMTCYSRYGRPIYGLFWIEEELQLLRALCGDPSLIVDGELYLHQSYMDDASVHAATSNKFGPTPVSSSTSAPTKYRRRKVPLPALAGSSNSNDCNDGTKPAADRSTSADTFKTGFLAVSALVHRLRGPSLHSATESDILQYVPALPRLCVFDIPSYSPCPNPLADLSMSSPSAWPQRVSVELNLGINVKEERVLQAELKRVRRAAMEQLCIRDVEQLRVVPNITLFSQRLRTMNFLFQMLEIAMGSTVLRTHFCPSQADRQQQPRGEVKESKHARLAKGAAAPETDAVVYHGGHFVCRIPYQLVTSLEETRQRILPAYLRHNYEGAVIRSPLNTYDFKEKRKGTLAALVAPLFQAGPTTAATARDVNASTRSYQKGVACALRGKRDRAALLLSLGSDGDSPHETTLMVRAYSNGAPFVEPLAPVNPANAILSDNERNAQDAMAVGEQAVRRTRQLPTRSETAVKVLAYQDREYAILRPLLKEPSKNPNTRVLVSIPRSSVSALGYPIKPDAETVSATAPIGKGGEEDGSSDKVTTTPAAAAAKRRTAKTGGAKSASSGASNPSPVVVFYGLQCLAENGLVFNVSVPKMTLTQQKALLDHLLAAGKRSACAGRRAKEKSQKKMTSLTGLYATVKFSTLTEHGLPRFGTVKAIRGGKGWFM